MGSPWNTPEGQALITRHQAGEISIEEAATAAGASVQSLKSKLGWARRHAEGKFRNSQYRRRDKKEEETGPLNELLPLVDMGAEAIGRAFKAKITQLQDIIQERTEALEKERAARERLEREFQSLRARFEERVLKSAGIAAPD